MLGKKINIDMLFENKWSFGKKGDLPFTQEMMFLADGKIIGDIPEEMEYWQVQKNVLQFLDRNRQKVAQVVLKHDYINQKAFYGLSVLEANTSVMLYLTTSDFAYTYEHIVKLEQGNAYLDNVNQSKLAEYYDLDEFLKDMFKWLSKSYSEDKKIIEHQELLIEDRAYIERLVIQLIGKVDDSYIAQYTPYWLRHHFWLLKHGQPHIKANELAPRFWFGSFVSPTEYLSGSISITELHEHDGVLTVRGFYTKPSYDGIELICQNGDQIIAVESLDSQSVNKKQFLGLEVMPAKTFSVMLTCQRLELSSEQNLTFYFKYQDIFYATRIHHTPTSRLAHSRKKFVGDQFMFFNASHYALSYSPLTMNRLTNELITEKTDDVFILIKFIENFANHVSRRIWVFIDTPRTIDDNAEVLFRYASQLEDGIEKYYIIPDDSFKKYFEDSLQDRLIVFGTWEQQFLYLIAEKLISSNSLQRSLIYPETFLENTSLTKIQKTNYFSLSNADYVFLSHGYTIGDSSTFINQYTADMQLLSIASPVELANMSNGKYQYDNVKATGLPRYDRYHIEDKSEKVIVFMPTFDKRYVHSDLRYSQSYYGSKHWQTISEILNHPRLISKLITDHYTFLFKPHPYLVPQLSDFTFKSPVVVADENWDYKRIMNEGAIAITDYSTAVFDFAYLKKPVLYLHNIENIKFQKEEIWTYERDGFGDICTSVDSIVDAIITLIETNCLMPDKYQARVDHFFTYQDRHNCQRTYEAILELPLHKRQL